MAPVSKKAKLGGKPVAGGGLNRFFGGSKFGDTATDAGVVAGTVAPPPAAVAAAPTPAKETAAAAGAAPVSGGLTDVQKQRIEENRRKALERKQAKKDGPAATAAQALAKPELPIVATAETPAPSPLKSQSPVKPSVTKKTGTFFNATSAPAPSPLKSPSPVKPSVMDRALKRKGSGITPEKAPLPVEHRQSAPADNRPDASHILPGEDKFRTFGKVSWMQYNSLYAARLDKLRGEVLTQARSLWSDVPARNFLPNIIANPTGYEGEVVFIGVTFKEMPSRDNVIAQYRDPAWATSCLPEEDVDAQKNLCSDADAMWLEDANFRIKLALSAEEVAKLATGFVVAARGTVTGKGVFTTKSICLPQTFASKPMPAAPPLNPETATGQYIALLSGLCIGAPDEDVQARSRALEFLSQQAVQHIIVCGGVYAVSNLQDVPAGLEDADHMFAQLAEKCQVDVMPGHKDPSNLSLPQMPLHPYFFRSARKCSQFKSVSNPYQCSVGGLEILGHSGQPIRDLMRCTSISTPLQALTTCLDARLLGPTAPDTLVTQPFEKGDPFTIDKTPQVFFSGGHSELEFEWREPAAAGSSGTLCVCVPAFHKLPSVVLVNLKDPRDVRVQEFGTKQA